MGARIALEALLYKNAPFLSLTCLCPTLEVADRESRIKEETLWKEMLIKSTIKDFVNYWYKNPLFTGFTIPKQRYRQNKGDLLNVLDEYSILKMPPLVEKLASTSITVKFIYKKDDKKALPIKNYPHLYFIDATSHAIHIENPHSCSLLLKQFMKATHFKHEHLLT
jgi:hypothetical protein